MKFIQFHSLVYMVSLVDALLDGLHICLELVKADLLGVGC